MNDVTGVALGAQIIDKTFNDYLIADRFVSPEAKVLLLAIGLQESGFVDRVQKDNGPAHSFWQEEPNGIKAVMYNSVNKPYLLRACNSMGIAFDWYDIYEEVINNDELACIVARLILYADPAKLPTVGDSDGAWEYYIANWRPGKPRPQDWPDNYKAAMEYING